MGKQYNHPNPFNCKRANLIPLTAIIESLGHALVKVTGSGKRQEYWYNSPFRKERKADSFSVNPTINVFYDFGNGFGGGPVDFVLQYFSLDNISQALTFLRQWQGEAVNHIHIDTPIIPSNVERPKKLIIHHTQPLTHPALTRYMQDRGISPQQFGHYVVEAYYQFTGQKRSKPWFAIGFENNKGGWELRNGLAHGKLSAAPKHFTWLVGIDNRTLDVFEGFFDFLSWLCLKRAIQLPNDVLVLNSISMIGKALPFIAEKDYLIVRVWLDTHAEGARKQFAILNSIVLYQHRLYFGYKDLNEYLQHNPVTGLTPTF